METMEARISAKEVKLCAYCSPVLLSPVGSRGLFSAHRARSYRARTMSSSKTSRSSPGSPCLSRDALAASEIEFPFVGFEQGHIDYVGARLDLDDTEFDLILTKLCTQVVVAGELALVSGEVCDSGPEGHVAGEVLSLELGEDYQVKSSFSWLPGSRITLALELPAWAPEPLRFANRRLLLIGEATVLVGQPEAGIVELEWKGQVWMEQVFRRGDSNDDGAVDLADAVFTLRSLFSSVGESPGCRDAADANGDGTLEVTDAIYELNHLFLGGPALAVPNVDHRSRTPRDPSTASVS